MWLNWNDFDGHFAALDAFRRQVERALHFDGRPVSGGLSQWTGAQITDEGERYKLTVDVPGLAQDDLALDLDKATLTVTAKREVGTPDGFTALRSERSGYNWTKTVTFPGLVDAEKTAATLTNGVLTVFAEKLAEAKPRRIAVS